MDNEQIWELCLQYKIQQKKTEFLWLIDKIKSISDSILGIDIGSYDGGSSAGLSCICKRLITIDANPMRFNPDKFKCHYQYIQGDSHLPEIKNKLVHLLASQKADFLFIDGDHSYAGTKLDYEMYNEFINPNGIIAFHDILFHPNGGCNVDKFWKELDLKFITEQITVEPLAWGGIGIIRPNIMRIFV
jgi:predicted O-methyltransferase YrrM